MRFAGARLLCGGALEKATGFDVCRVFAIVLSARLVGVKSVWLLSCGMGMRDGGVRMYVKRYMVQVIASNDFLLYCGELHFISFRALSLLP